MVVTGRVVVCAGRETGVGVGVAGGTIEVLRRGRESCGRAANTRFEQIIEALAKASSKAVAILRFPGAVIPFFARVII